nr:MAG TPA: hypothetical protein [Caudoviricetes sp.]
MTLTYIGMDDFGRETYVDKAGTIWKYTEPGPMPRERHDTLYIVSGNDKDSGEPESPMPNNTRYQIIGSIPEVHA